MEAELIATPLRRHSAITLCHLMNFRRFPGKMDLITGSGNAWSLLALSLVIFNFEYVAAKFLYFVT